MEELQGVGRGALEWGRIFHPELAGSFDTSLNIIKERKLNIKRLIKSL